MIFMKSIGILLLIFSAGYSVIIYTGQIKKPVSELREWCTVLSFWKEQIGVYGYAVDELSGRLRTHPVYRSLDLCEKIGQGGMAEVITYASGEECSLSSDAREIVLEILSSLGTHLAETQDAMLAESIGRLKEKLIESDKNMRQRCAVIYKIAPLLCGALIVLCW